MNLYVEGLTIFHQNDLVLFDYIENYQDNECNMKYLPMYLYQTVKCLIKYNIHIFTLN